MTYQELKDEEQLYLMHTYGRFPAALDHGKGATLWDIDGKKYIDLTSGIGVSSLGHDNEALVSALNEQAHKLLHASNLYLTEPMVQVAKELVTSCGMGKIFFSNSGAEANEGMIKLARKYSYDKYGEGRNKIITLKQSFHGRTVTTLKATGQEKFHQYFYPFTEGFDYAAANDIKELKDKADDSVCAVMIELIQGEGGVLPLDKEYVQQAAEFCRAKDILFLIDEVQTGIGRTGSLFCYEQYGVKPDVVSMAKGLGGGVPVGAVMASEICADVLGAGTHGTTFGGNPFCCAAARTVLSVVNKPEFLKEVQRKGEYLKNAILAIGSDKIKTVRGMGLMLGIVVDKESRAEMVNRLLEKGVLALTAGEETIRLLPPLVISYEEMDSAVAVIKEVF
ncbi:aspartate aminotransferase family protein [[Clostridium] symbiosum]|uniref:aspartate aminotransferase family protein n=1 Tax=Clostridium symbiosum TaxID=1512 RepID=UPI0023308EBA|nr:aspartate aminotransferase family protein [[Clostridium] symbiosum]MDB2010952.1 aspartate aminotransferase family protein [[Clostridium] symbiosum]MDB2029074.1 aspartate aminotransferase family protein [[Clostridium] symbiosum]